MAYTQYRTRPAALSSRATYSFGGLVDRVTAWNEARRTRNALSKLSTHELEDIGLVRGDIDRIANPHF